MEVLKFGGTSVGSEQGRQRIYNLAKKCKQGCVIVVSALGGVTDMLILLSKQKKNSDNYNELLNKIEHRHLDAVKQSIEKNKQQKVWEEMKTILEELKKSEGESNMVSFGEKLSSKLMAHIIEGAIHLDSLKVISTFKYFNRHIIDFVKTNAQLESALEDKRRKIVVMGGFISADRDTQEITNLGRGGSDYTAAIVAAAINAKKLYIYTDVDGFLSADPRIIPNAILLEQLGYIEAMELCNYGAKVLYSPTIFPAFNADIPIVIRNTYGNHPGTTINKNVSDDRIASGVTSINDTALIKISGAKGNELTGLNYKIFKELSNAGVSLILVGRDKNKKITQLALKNGDCDKAIQIIENKFATEINTGIFKIQQVQKNLATIAVVGKGLGNSTQGMAKLLSSLEEHGVEILASSGGESGSVMGFVTQLGSLRKAVAMLHTALFEMVISELNIYVFGNNNISRKFITFAQNNKKQLFENQGLKLKFHNIEAGGIHSIWTENSVVVDCSCGELSGNDYIKLLASDINIVSVSAMPMKGSSNEYLRIRSAQGVARLRYNATVGSGLPVLRTIESLLGSGDEVLEVQVLLPGDIECACEQLLILARECGFSFEAGDIVRDMGDGGDLIGVIDSCGLRVEGRRLDHLCPLYNCYNGAQTVLLRTKRYREYPLQLRGFDDVIDFEGVLVESLYFDVISLGGMFRVSL